MPPAPTPGSELTLAASSASAAQPTGAEATLAMSAGDATIASVRQSPRPADEALVPGARLGRYVLERLLGQGGMGTVYIAHDPDLDRKVAIKVLHTGVAATDATSGPQRLLREAQAMARLSHPNVVAVHDVGVVGSRLFIAMELIDGSDLRRWLAETKRPWQAIVEVFVAAGAGLAAAHDAGIIHRDFKPKSRRPSQTAPQPTDRPHSHSQGRFERVDVDRAAPGRPGVPHVLAKRWQRAGPPEDQRGHGPRNTCWCVVGPLPIMTDAVQRFTSAVPRRKPCGQ